MGSDNYIKALNSSDKMKESLKIWLIREFDKERNIVGRFPDIGELIRVENRTKGWKHYYFNISGFFDPDKGFLKVLDDIYKRYIEIKLNEKNLLPFGSLLTQPYKKIQELLKITEGSFLDDSLCLLYGFVVGSVIDVAIILAATRIHPIVGITVGATVIGILAYESYKEAKNSKEAEFIKREENLLFTKITELLKNFDRYLQYCNVIEFKVDESFNSIIDGIFKYDSKNKVIVNFWNIPGIEKAKTINQLPEKNKKIYKYIVNKMGEFKDSGNKDFNEIYYYIKKNYNSIDQEANNIINESERNRENAKKRNEILDKIEEYRKSDPNDQRIEDLLKKLKELN